MLDSGYGSDNKYTERCCLPPKKEYTLKCKNVVASSGNNFGGWKGGFIEIGGKKYCDDFTTGKEVTKQVTVQPDSTGTISFDR